MQLTRFALALTFLCACANDGAALQNAKPLREPVAFATGKAQLTRLCGRGRSDLMVDLFCTAPAPHIDSFVALRAALGLPANEQYDIHEGFALTAHSTALNSRTISAINPRIIFVRTQSDEKPFISFSFARGEQFSEIVVRDRITDRLQFYLLRFSQACNHSAQGCSPGDLLSEAVESGWRDVNVYGEEDLENTPLDCLVCHQPDGPNTPKLLRMQELQPPWNHWFWHLVVGGQAVFADYHAAKGDEVFAGVPGDVIETSQPGLLSAELFFEGSGTQPNEFVSDKIETEVTESAAKLGGHQPDDNSVPGKSATWDAIYKRAKRGEAISVPYHDVKVTDAKKLARMTQAYVDYRAGKLDRQKLPDLRDIYPDDPLLRAQIGLDTEPGLDGQGVLLQACAQCHNDRLDQTLSRSRFNVDLTMLDRDEKERAIARLSLPSDDAAAMPPSHARQLTDQARSRLIALLKR